MIESIEQLIGTMGFPIAVCIYLFWERQTTTKEMIKVLRELNLAIVKLGGMK